MHRSGEFEANAVECNIILVYFGGGASIPSTKSQVSMDRHIKLVVLSTKTAFLVDDDTKKSGVLVYVGFK